jgi:hypothetical protein
VKRGAVSHGISLANNYVSNRVLYDKTMVLVRCLSNDGFRAEASVGYPLFYSTQVA